MKRQCPHCGSISVRRSGRLESESGTHAFHSPYRCRDCEQRFWVISRKTLFGAAAGGTVLALALILSGIALLGRHDSAPLAPVGSAADFRLSSPQQLSASPQGRVLADTVLNWGARVDGSRQPAP